MKAIDKALDKAWSELVKLRACKKCEYCGKGGNMNSHHVFTRNSKATRWDVHNGVCLCVSHHTALNTTFSAHGTPTLFTKWIIKKRGEQWHDLLTLRTHQISKLHDFEKKLLLKELQRDLSEYDESHF